MLTAECHKVYRANDNRVMPVALAVLHWTASPPRAPEAPDEARVRAWLADGSRASSTHLVILRDGLVLQAAGLDERTWHAGGSTWTGPDGVARKSINLQSIGIDLENVGYVRRAPEGEGFIDGYGGRYKGATPVRAAGGWYEPYTPAQLASLSNVVHWLARTLPVLRDPARWVGHSQIQTGKVDPGPLFPWQAVQGIAASAGSSC